MTDEARDHLEDLQDELAAAADDGHDMAAELHGELQDYLDTDEPGADDHDALRDQLSDSLLHFEVSHPSLSAAMQRVIDSLTASGI